jgi:hypothetical protein
LATKRFCLNWAFCKQFTLSKTKGMFTHKTRTLVAVVRQKLKGINFGRLSQNLSRDTNFAVSCEQTFRFGLRSRPTQRQNLEGVLNGKGRLGCRILGQL